MPPSTTPTSTTERGTNLIETRDPGPVNVEHANRIVLTPTGLPLQRPGIHYVNMIFCWLILKAGPRTTVVNVAPRGFDTELDIIMGHSGGSVRVEHDLETTGDKYPKKPVAAVLKASGVADLFR